MPFFSLITFFISFQIRMTKKRKMLSSIKLCLIHIVYKNLKQIDSSIVFWEDFYKTRLDLFVL